MNKYQRLKEKLKKIEVYLKSLEIKDEATKNYINYYEEYISKLIVAIDKKTIQPSNGALLGLIRGISDFDELCSDEKLWKLVQEADNYYSNECKVW